MKSSLLLLLKRLCCVHSYTGGVRRVYKRGKVKYAHICKKCGKRYYIN